VGDVLDDAALDHTGRVLGADQHDRHGGLDRLVQAHAHEVDVHHLAADHVTLGVLDDRRGRMPAVD